MSYTQWVSNGTNVSYVPKEKDTGEVITPFTTTAPGGVPNSSYAPSTYVLAASGAWIPQTVGTSSSEVRRPTAYTLLTSNPSPYFEATDTSLVYDSDTNHLTTNGRFELQGLSAQNDASFKFSSFQTKAQTWTSATLNISRNYASTRWTSGTEARYYLSTDGGTNWTLLLTDDYDNDPVTVTIFSHTLATSNPSSLSNYQVKVEIDAFSSGALGSVGVLDLQLYDIWIEGIYTVSGGSGTVTSITTTGANGVTISGGSTQTITTSGTFALALGNITPTSISTGTGSFSGDVEFAASIKSPNGSNSPVTIVPDGTGDLHVNADSLRLGDNNANATIATNGTGDLILTTHEGSATEGVIRLYDGANGNITLTPNGTGQVQVGSDQVVTLTASQTLTNKTLSTNSTWNGNTIGVAYGGTGSTTLTSGSYVVGNGTSAVTLKTPTQVTADLDTFTYQIGATAGKKGLVPAAPAIGASVVYLDQTGSWTTPSGSGTTTNALTIQSPLTGTSFDGSTAVTIGLGTVAVANGGTGLTSLTAGRIPYGSGTSAFGSSANLFWDSTNSRLGLGITTPSATLHLQGSSPYIWIYNDDETDSGIKFGDTQNTGERFQVVYDSAVAALKFVHVNDAASTLTERLRITSSGQLVLGNGDTSATPTTSTFRATDGSGTDIAGANLAIQGGRSTGTGTGGSITFNTAPAAGTTGSSLNSPSERMRINQFGSVGIGTSSPSRILHVTSAATAATCNFTSTATPAYSATSHNGGNARILLVGGNASGATTGIQFSQTGSFELYFGGVQESAGAAAFVWQGYSGAAYAERMRLDSAGNLGIGSTSPAAKLDVRPSANNILLFKSASHSTLTGLGPAITFSRGNDGSTDLAALMGWNNGGLALSARAGITFATGGGIGYSATSQAMTLDASGNLGIGTASPINKLTILGSTLASGELGSFAITGSTTAKRLAFGVDSTATMYGWIQSVESGIGFRDIALQPLGGNVGIGTVSPSAKLQVNSSGITPLNLVGSTACQINLNDGTQNANWGLGVGGVGITGIASPSTYPLVMYTNGSERMRIDSSGNVGIGTSSPTVGLHVVKDQGSGYIAAFRANTSSPYITLQTTSGITQIQGINSAFTDVNNIAMQLSGGNVGIGEAAPASRLTVRKDLYGGRGGEISIVNYAGTALGSEAALNFGLEASTYDADNGNAQIKARITNASNAASDMIFSTWNGSAFGERVRITSDGNVSVGSTSSTGTATPITMNLGGTFSSTAGANPKLRVWTDGTNSYGLGVSSNQLDYIIPSSASHTWFIAGSEQMRLNSTGLGIGTASPTEKLTVTGKIKASDVLLGNNGTKGYGAITTTTSTSTPTGGSSGDHYYIY